MYSLRNKGETKMDFGDKLKQYRLKEGLSQEQLAEKIGVSRQAITNGRPSEVSLMLKI